MVIKSLIILHIFFTFVCRLPEAQRPKKVIPPVHTHYLLNRILGFFFVNDECINRLKGKRGFKVQLGSCYGNKVMERFCRVCDKSKFV